MLILGLSLAFLIGISLGLIGSGGSILAVPTLIYVMGIEPRGAIAMSLIIVGFVSLIGMIPYWRQGKISFRTVAFFTPTAMIGAFLGAKITQLSWITPTVQLVTFGLMMLSASVLMIRKARPKKDSFSSSFESRRLHLPKRKAPAATVGQNNPRLWLIPLEGLGVGILTGFVGIGGGFLIIPALVLVSKIPMKEAVGTSLLMIALNSVAGFLGYLGQVKLNWLLLSWFTIFAIAGVIAGSYSSRYVEGEKLQKGFGYFLIAVAVFILIKR